MHVGIGEDADIALPVDAARLDQRVLGFAAVRAAIHAQCAADAAGDAAHEREPRDRRFLRGARDFHVRHRGAGADAMARFHRDLVEPAAEPDRNARYAAVAHDQVGAKADRGHRDFGGKLFQEIREIVFVVRHEHHLRRTADAKPGQLGKRLVRQQTAAQLRHLRFQLGGDVRKTHSYPSAFNSPGSA